MAFTDHKISAFTHTISELADQPNLPPDELKARFDACPEELRVAHNALCDEAARLDERVGGIVDQSFADTVTKAMLSAELRSELDAKATQSALSSEISARSALASRMSSAESKLNTHTTQIAQKCEMLCGTYTGDNAASRAISLGFRPKAVLVFCCGYLCCEDRVSAALAVDGTPVSFQGSQTNPAALEVTSSGFTVKQGSNMHLNYYQLPYFYIAFR